MNAEKLALEFYNFAHAYDWNDRNLKFTEEDVSKALELLTSVGFKLSQLVSGEIVIWLTDQGGSKIRPDGVLNDKFPFIAVDDTGSQSQYITGWFNQIIKRARGHMFEEKEDTLVDLAEIIERSVPLEPIPLTVHGDLLIDCEPNTISGVGNNFHRARVTDYCKLDRSTPGIHKYCSGYFDYGRVTKNHNVLLCRNCSLRILTPRDLETYGDLRHFMEEKIAATVPKY